MPSKPVTVRLSEEQVGALDRLGPSRSEAVKSLIESSGAVWAKQSMKAADEHDLSGYTLVPADRAPESEAMRKLELFMAAGQAGIELGDSYTFSTDSNVKLGEQILNTVKRQEEERLSLIASLHESTQVVSYGNGISEPKRDVNGTGINNPFVIDPTTRAMMQLAEFYCISEGDLWQMILVPLEVGYQDYDFPTGDKGARRAAREFLEHLDSHRIIEEIWLSRQTYGQAYPIKVRSGKHVDSILVPNSKHIAVGRMTGLSTEPAFSYMPSSIETAEALYKASPSFLYTSTAWTWNEQMVRLQGIPLNPGDITHIHVPKFAQHFYAVPPLARATRSVDSRRFLEEMARATIEGVKNQLWVFYLENPRPGEAALLSQTLAGARGARTGYLVWGSNLKVDQFVPGSIDHLLAPETTWNYTLKVYRDMGISIKMISGENPTNSSKAGDSTTDVDITLDRLMYSRRQIYQFFQSMVDEEIGLSPSGEPKARMRLADVSLKIAENIKNKVIPLMNYGLLSPSSALSMSGLDVDSEKSQHETDNEFRNKYIRPYSGFAQDGPTGKAEEVNKGRPAGKVEMKPRAQKAEANLFTASTESDYENDVKAAFQNFVAYMAGATLSESEKRDAVLAFIALLMGYAEKYRSEAYREGYERGNGSRGLDRNRLEASIHFDDTNAMKFQDALLGAIVVGEDLNKFAGRADLYATAGYRQAFANGLMDAKREDASYTHWQRVLHFDSRTGPCAFCRADSRTLHPITEDFFDHPNGRCSQLFLRFYRRPDMPGGAIGLPDVWGNVAETGAM